MAAKEILFSQPARQAIAHGLNLLANTVKVTLGPRGRNVIIEKSWGSPTVTKDGVTVAKEVELADKMANMGAQMVKEVASKTSDVAGDGTIRKLDVKEGDKVLFSKYSGNEIKMDGVEHLIMREDDILAILE